MTPPMLTRTTMLACAAAVIVVLLGGCGSGSTKTVSVANSPTQTPGATTATQPTTSTATTRTGATTTGTSSGGTPAPTTTRTAAAPAFTEHEHSAGTAGLPAAIAVIRAHGYTASDPSQYHPDQTLRVLVGTGSHSNDGYDKQAFFFLDGHYLGTDAARPSAQISVVSQSDTEVTLSYALYRAADPLCCPGGGQARVRFQLNNGRLVPLDPLPPVSSSAGTSRQ